MADAAPATLDHIYRAALPWRTDRQNECGRPAADVARVVTVGEVQERIRKYGQQRTAFTVCITCLDAAKRNTSWADNPAAVMWRHTARADASPGSPAYRDIQHLNAELRAIEALIDVHRDEFDAYLHGLAETASLSDRRKNRCRAAVDGGPFPPPIRLAMSELAACLLGPLAAAAMLIPPQAWPGAPNETNAATSSSPRRWMGHRSHIPRVATRRQEDPRRAQPGAAAELLAGPQPTHMRYGKGNWRDHRRIEG